MAAAEGTPNRVTRGIEEFLADVVKKPEAQDAVEARLVEADGARYRFVREVARLAEVAMTPSRSLGLYLSGNPSCVERLGLAVRETASLAWPISGAGV